MKTNCLFCKKMIRSGRSDKKFCDSICKDAYYNAKKAEDHSDIKKIDMILKKNRRILKKLFTPKNKTLPKNALVNEGFSFEFHTHVITTKLKGNQFIFCYDHGYREISEGQIQIIKSFAR
jgi:hypothetical protein